MAIAVEVKILTSSHAHFMHSNVNYDVTFRVPVQIGKVALGYGPSGLAFADRGEVEVNPAVRYVLGDAIAWIRRKVRNHGQLHCMDRGSGVASEGWGLEHHRWRRHIGRVLSAAGTSLANMVWLRRHAAMILSTLGIILIKFRPSNL